MRPSVTTRCGEPLHFKPGSVFKFFETLKIVSGLDLLGLVGGGMVGGPNPEESELCCGGLEAEVTLAAVAKCNFIENNEEEQERARNLAKTKGLDADWFISTSINLGHCLQERLAKGGETLALFLSLIHI
eukprot:TRINITY_DN8315_c0_g1_i2.p1 TRINITY_DN8315_c0_g1~~TRINITY_DN8315_c0_g1_i2.p1  ORF type:complete len:130 (-),score=25.62 TRINITY_DN8315_c0_g1_i2:31-420(-)